MLLVGVTSFAVLADAPGGAVVLAFAALGMLAWRTTLLREALHGAGAHRVAVVSEMAAAVVALVCIEASQASGQLTLETASSRRCLVGLGVQMVVVTTVCARLSPRESDRGAGGGADRALVRRMASFSIPALVASMGAIVPVRVDRLVLAWLEGPADVGVYATASTLAGLAWLVPSALTVFVTRRVAIEGDLSSHRHWWRRGIAATAAMGVVIMAGSVYVFGTFLGPEFGDGVLIVAVLLLGALPMFSQQLDLAACVGLGRLRATARWR